MRNRRNERYLNFPVILLKGFLFEPYKCLENIRDYSVYDMKMRLPIHNTNNDEKLEQVAMSFFGIDEADFFNGEDLCNQIRYDYPKAGLNISIFYDFYHYEKTEFEKVCLLAFLSIKSILQNKSYCLITNLYWFSRMCGEAKKLVDKSLIDKDIAKYYTRHYVSKIKEQLQLNWGLKEYSYGVRGSYFSFKLDLESLIKEVELKKSKRKAICLKKEKKRILQKVLNDIN